MGWRDALKKVSNPGPDWEAWATDRGWRYEAEAPELAGRFLPVPPDPDRTGEKYFDVVRGEWNGRPFVKFHRQMWGRQRGGTTRNYEVVAGVAVQLPGRPAPSLASQPPDAAFRTFGSLEGKQTWSWAEPDWLVGVSHLLRPEQAQGILEQVERALSQAPPGAFTN